MVTGTVLKLGSACERKHAAFVSLESDLTKFFCFVAAGNFTVYVNHILCSSVDGSPGWFHFQSPVNSAAVKMDEQAFLCHDDSRSKW